MKWLVFLSIILFSVACANDSKDVVLKNVSLNVNLDAEKLGSGGGLKTTAYKRGEAPVYIKGVELTANNNEYEVDEVKQTFLFASDKANEGDDIVMTGLSVGENVITAKGLPRYGAKTKYYWDIYIRDGDDLDKVAKECHDYMVKRHPIYAEYNSENPVKKVISNEGENSIKVNMVSQNYRVAIIVNNRSDKYNITTIINENGRYKVGLSLKRFQNFAYIINDRNARGTKTYDIKMTYYTKDTYKEMGSFTRQIVAERYDDITKLYRFANNELKEGDARASISWNTKDIITGGEDIE